MQAKPNNGGVQQAAGERIESYSRSAHEAVDRAAEAAGRVAERVGEQIDSLAEKRDELIGMPAGWLEEARDYVREHPFQALGMALATGYLLSVVMRSSSR